MTQMPHEDKALSFFCRSVCTVPQIPAAAFPDIRHHKHLPYYKRPTPTEQKPP